MARILAVWEAAYKFRRLPAVEQDIAMKYKFIAEHDFDNCEAGSFLDVIRNYSFQEIRRYLLDNHSTMVRVGKKTRPKDV